MSRIAGGSDVGWGWRKLRWRETLVCVPRGGHDLGGHPCLREARVRPHLHAIHALYRLDDDRDGNVHVDHLLDLTAGKRVSQAGEE
jgi:hypothetical protein